MNKHLNNQAAFTLIEVMVAVSIFVIVAMIATGAIITLSGASKKIQTVKAGIDNLDSTLSNMANRIREGSSLTFAMVVTSNPNCFSRVNFVDFDNHPMSYYITTVGSQTGVRRIYDNKYYSWLTADNITISKLMFCKPVGIGSGRQAIIISMIGVIDSGSKYETKVALQTAVAQRNSTP